MAEKASNPANPNLNIHPPPFAADDSDNEFIPTPIHSPRNGPSYDDLPPSYEDAQEQAIRDARSGVAPLDPNELEAHRLTVNEAPGAPEVWEYRRRGEELDATEEFERAPEYQNVTNHVGTTIPVQHVPASEYIPVGRTEPTSSAPTAPPDSTAILLTRALEFTRHEPDSDVQYAPRLTRSIAIPQIADVGQRRQSNNDTIQFLRAYAKALHAHSIRPAEFAEFLDGLNALCLASNSTYQTLIPELPATDSSLSVVQNYLDGANEAFFAPRGLRVSLRSLSALVEASAIPVERGQRAGAVASVLDEDSTAERRAQALHPWIEALDTNVPEPSAQMLMLREMGQKISNQRKNNSMNSSFEDTSSHGGSNFDIHRNQYEDPPHSVPETVHHQEPPGYEPFDHGHQRHHGNRTRCSRGGPRTPFGMRGHGPFGAPGHGPSGGPGHGPFGGAGRGPFGAHGRGGRGGRGGPNRTMHPAGRAGDHRAGNDWAALGKDLGKMGEEFGKRMEEWGQQFGKQAEAWGENVGRQASTWGNDVATRASGSCTRGGRAIPRAEEEPPAYMGPPGQKSGVILHEDGKSDTSGLKLDKKTAKKEAKKEAQKEKRMKHHDDDDDSSSSESDSDSDLDSDSDSDEEELPDTEAIFLKRVRSINKQAEQAEKKGKKSAQEIAKERDLAIEEAQNDKVRMDIKYQLRNDRARVRREHRKKSRNLRDEYREKKRELRAAHAAHSGNVKGKGKDKAIKTPAWKEARREYREKRKVLKTERKVSRKEWKTAKSNNKKLQKQAVGSVMDVPESQANMVWVVIENLGH